MKKLTWWLSFIFMCSVGAFVISDMLYSAYLVYGLNLTVALILFGIILALAAIRLSE